MALALNSEGLGVNANWLDFTVCEHVWLGGQRGTVGASLSKYIMCYWCPFFKLFFKQKGLWNNII